MMSFETLKVEQLQQGTIVRVTLNRPQALNAMNTTFFKQIGQAFAAINLMPNVRAAILRSQGKVFSAGLDLKQAGAQLAALSTNNQDPARSAVKMTQWVRACQESFVKVFKCRVPVIAGIHSVCIGGAVDLISTADIRYCTKQTKFAIKEIDIGQAPDLSTLQLFPKVVGNNSTFRQLAYTARFMAADQAQRIGFVSRILQDKDKLDEACMETARTIAAKSPVGVYTIKQTLVNAELREYMEGLEYVVTTNGVMLQTGDMVEAISSFMQKRKPVFPRL